MYIKAEREDVRKVVERQCSNNRLASDCIGGMLVARRYDLMCVMDGIGCV